VFASFNCVPKFELPSCTIYPYCRPLKLGLASGGSIATQEIKSKNLSKYRATTNFKNTQPNQILYCKRLIWLGRTIKTWIARRTKKLENLKT
jgi:hypothetical protein